MALDPSKFFTNPFQVPGVQPQPSALTAADSPFGTPSAERLAGLNAPLTPEQQAAADARKAAAPTPTAAAPTARITQQQSGITTQAFGGSGEFKGFGRSAEDSNNRTPELQEFTKGAKDPPFPTEDETTPPRAPGDFSTFDTTRQELVDEVERQRLRHYIRYKLSSFHFFPSAKMLTPVSLLLSPGLMEFVMAIMYS